VLTLAACVRSRQLCARHRSASPRAHTRLLLAAGLRRYRDADSRSRSRSKAGRRLAKRFMPSMRHQLASSCQRAALGSLGVLEWLAQAECDLNRAENKQVATVARPLTKLWPPKRRSAREGLVDVAAVASMLCILAKLAAAVHVACRCACGGEAIQKGRHFTTGRLSRCT
jgi:hypothetical protein